MLDEDGTDAALNNNLTTDNDNDDVATSSANNETNSTQDDILSHFQEVTGKTEVEECLRLLDESNWNLEQAVQLSFNPPAPSQPVPSQPIPDLMVDELDEEDSRPDYGNINNIQSVSTETFGANMRQRVITSYSNPMAAAPGPSNTFVGPLPRNNISTGPIINRNNRSALEIVYSGIWDTVSWPVKTIYSIVIAVLQFALSFFFTPGPPTQRQASQEVEKYISEFDTRYGVNHPRFYHGTYREAVNHAKKHLRFLLVYIHNEENPVAVRFAKNVICTSLLKSVVEDNLLLWSCSTKKHEGECVAESLNKARPPFLALLCCKEGQMRMVYKNQGFATIEAIISRLTTSIVENEPHLNRQRRNRDRISESSASQMIMQEQDAAFNESLIRDQERARKKKEEEDAVRKIQEEEDRVKKVKEDKIAARLALRQKLKLSIVEESKEDTIALLFRLPNGSRVSRKFSPSSLIKDVYEFAMTCDESPNFFDLVSNFPKRVLPCEGECYLKSCLEMGIQTSTTLFVQERDSDDEGSSDSEAEL